MRRPDSFAILLGAYVGALTFTVVVALAGRATVRTAAPAAGSVAFLAVVAFATRRGNLAATMARSQLHAVLLGVPALALVGWMLVYDALPAAERTVLPWIPFLVVALLVGLAAYLLANQRVLAAARADDAVIAEWQAGPTRRQRWALRGVTFLGATALLGVGVYYPDAVFLGEFAPTAAGILFAATAFAGRRRHYVALPDGLYVQDAGSLGGRYVPWSRLTGYDVTDRTLVIDRWLPLLAFRSAREDVPDLGTVTDALDSRLARRS
ncbi:hypothetical protein ACFR9U_00145 [Halorientalis brevis]|uniref:PH domain-containing protein n=1 Tax=Halorientalis brevis TaxID=1126241 RepID=A0ABD6C6Q6_9EURY|nr:hypothetical protein [Halorientalis brevis]